MISVARMRCAGRCILLIMTNKSRCSFPSGLGGGFIVGLAFPFDRDRVDIEPVQFFEHVIDFARCQIEDGLRGLKH